MLNKNNNKTCVHAEKNIEWLAGSRQVGLVVARSTADREVPGSNTTLA